MREFRDGERCKLDKEGVKDKKSNKIGSNGVIYPAVFRLYINHVAYADKKQSQNVASGNNTERNH